MSSSLLLRLSKTYRVANRQKVLPRTLTTICEDPPLGEDHIAEDNQVLAAVEESQSRPLTRDYARSERERFVRDYYRFLSSAKPPSFAQQIESVPPPSLLSHPEDHAEERCQERRILHAPDLSIPTEAGRIQLVQ